MSRSILVLLLIIGIILQVFVTTIPFMVGVMLILYITVRNESVFVMAVVAGMAIDTLSIRPMGLSSMIFVSFLALVHLYERKFEIQTKEFVVLGSFLGSMMYGVFTEQNYVFFQATVSSIISILLFLGIVQPQKKRLE